jgi:hypothetical protein
MAYSVNHLYLSTFLLTILGAIWGCYYLYSLPLKAIKDSNEIRTMMFIVCGVIPLPAIFLTLLIKKTRESRGYLFDLESIKID